MLPHEKALERAKLELMIRPNTAFFTTICFSVRHIFDDSIPTAETDGLTIKYNTQFFMSLTPDEQLFLLLHEVMHIALQHMLRGTHMDQERWGKAADYVINDVLINRGFKMPSGGLYNPDYHGLSANEVYERIPESCTIKLPMKDLVMTSGNGQEATELKQKIDDILVRASIQAKMANNTPGSVPTEIQAYLDKLLNPKLPWHHILKRYMSKTIKDDYSFRKPNRRFMPDHILPSAHSETLMDITLAIDVSSSVTKEQFDQFVSEAYALMRQFKPTKLTILQFNARIVSETVVRSARELRHIKFHRYGGTRIHPVMDWAAKHKPNLLLVFTDGYYDDPRDDPKCPVIWIINDNPEFTAPFGRTILFDLD